MNTEIIPSGTGDKMAIERAKRKGNKVVIPTVEEKTKMQESGVSNPVQKKEPPVKETKPTKKPVDQSVIDDVYAGKYGKGADRFEALAAAGYDPEEVQNAINNSARGKSEIANKAEVRNKTQETKEEAVNEETESTNPAGESSKTTAESTEINLEDGTEVADMGGVKDVLRKVSNLPDGQEKDAVEAAKNGDVSQLGRITDENGESILAGSYDKNGYFVPAPVDRNKDKMFLGSKKGAFFATIISAAITAAGVALGIPIPFFDFNKERNENIDKSVDDFINVRDYYTQLVNDPKAAAEKIRQESNANLEADVNRMDEAQNYTPEEIQKGASFNAATKRADNSTMDVNAQNIDYEKWSKTLDTETQKWLKNKDVDLAQWLNNADSAQQIAMAKLLNDQNNHRIIDQIEYGKAHGWSADQMAQLVKKLNGITNVDAVMDNIGKGANILTSIANSVTGFIPGGGGDGKSDKRVKVYDAKSAAAKANTNMFKSTRRR